MNRRQPIPRFLLALFLGSFAGIFGTSMADAQIAPHSVLKSFSLPRYNLESYRDWTLNGDEGTYDPGGLFLVKGMLLQVYSGDEHQNLNTLIQSDYATFDLKNNLAYSDSPIRIISDQFEIHGTGWSWVGSEQKVVIEHQVSIRFTQQLDLDLNHLL